MFSWDAKLKLREPQLKVKHWEGKKQRWKVVESKDVGETLGRRKRLPTRARR